MHHPTWHGWEGSDSQDGRAVGDRPTTDEAGDPSLPAFVGHLPPPLPVMPPSPHGWFPHPMAMAEGCPLPPPPEWWFPADPLLWAPLAYAYPLSPPAEAQACKAEQNRYEAEEAESERKSVALPSARLSRNQGMLDRVQNIDPTTAFSDQ